MTNEHIFTAVLIALGVGVWAAASGTAVGSEDLGMSNLFGDNMVLQRGRATPVWGWAAPGQTVTVAVAGQTQTTIAGNDGKWMVMFVDLPATTEPVEMTVNAKSTITIKNVLIGDVWVGSGQSNIELPLSAPLNAEQEIAAANFPKIRLFAMSRRFKGQPRDDVDAHWVECSPGTVPNFSAVLYFFGREIHQRTGIPLGLISSTVGGTCIERWIPGSAYPEFPDPANCAAEIERLDESYRGTLRGVLDPLGKWVNETRAALQAGTAIPQTPEWPEPPVEVAATLYNGMIHPLIPFGIRGVVWYQGEANGTEGDTYLQKMQALIGSWRKLWGRGEFPFYYVQLANYLQPTTNPEGADGWSTCREAQRNALTIPNTGMAVAIDIGDAGNIHPKNKQDVGKRLALWALKNDYGMSDVVCSGPLYRGMDVQGSEVRISFDYVGSGLMVGLKQGLEPTQEVKGGTLKGFAIAGADKKWYWANARIEGDQVVVASPDVPNPVAVRYAFRGNPEGCNLYNKEGLPASPFRTDKW